MPASPGDKYTVLFENNAAPTIPSTIGVIVAGATKRCWLTELNIGVKNSTALAGAKISVGRPTTSGTGGAAIVAQPIDPSAPAAIFTALTATTIWSAEPTQPGVYLYQAGIDVVASQIWTPPEPILINVSTRLAVRVEADASSTKVQWVVTATIQE